MPYLSRRSTKVIPPIFLVRCTHPASVTFSVNRFGSNFFVEELEGITDRAVFMRDSRVLAVRSHEELRARDIGLADAYREVYGMKREVRA